MSPSERPFVTPRRWGSLRLRLPLIVSLLLLATVTALGTAAYLGIRAAVIETAQARLQGTARQFSTLLAQSTAQRSEEAIRIAARPAFRRVLDQQDDAAVREARAELRELLAAAPQTLSIELWRVPGQRIAHAVASESKGGKGLPPDHAFTPPTATGVMPLRALNGLLFTELVMRVPDSATHRTARGTPTAAVGYLVVRRRATNPNSAEAMRLLLGGGVSLRIGSRATGIWTDLSKEVAAPPVANKADQVVSFVGTDGQPWLGTEAAIPRLPWSVWVEIPRATALAAADAFWRHMARVGLVLVALGTLLTWTVSRRITTPLIALTNAVEAIAAGQFSERVHSTRRDEVGRLAHAFNSMADEVQAGYGRLDLGIRERTQELEHTLTALEDAQQQLVRREKLAMLGQLASGVGHELRNPLGVMTNAVYYLEMVQPDASADVQEYHGILRAQIGLSEKIIGDLLDFSRIKPPARQRLALADIVEAQLARLVERPGIEIKMLVARDIPPVHVDGIQIGQVVFNLLVNAVQALEECGGILTIRSSMQGDLVTLEIHDDGPGVPAEVKAKIFEPLFTTKARGIGLGLAVSRSLAEANGGTLMLADQTEAGACFTLTMPISSAQEAAA